MTTYIRENLFLTTNELLFINNHVFEKLLETPHIKATLKTLSLLLSSLSSLSLLCSLSRSALSSLFLGAVATPDVVLYRRKSSPSSHDLQEPAAARTTTRLHEPRPGCTNTTRRRRTSDRRWEPTSRRRPEARCSRSSPAIGSAKQKRNKKPKPNLNLGKKKRKKKMGKKKKKLILISI